MSTEKTSGIAALDEVKDSTVLRDSDRERPTSDESSGEGEVASEGDDGLEVVASHRSAPVLTMSKARAIALVATVTGASFLNVGTNACMRTTLLAPLPPSQRH